jgi:hypoxanthine-guanine phosphoribosyltransferase
MPSPVSKEMRDFLDRRLLSKDEIDDAVSSLAKRIEDYYLPGDFGLVAILPHASAFTTDLMRKIRMPVRFFPAAVSATYKDQSVTGKVNYDVSGIVHEAQELPPRVLIVTTVADASLDWLTFVGDICRRLAHVRNVRTCALFQTSDCDSESNPVDFLGAQLPTETRKFVGYGLGYKGYFAQHEDIYTLRKDF